jgi:hypothetical protein
MTTPPLALVRHTNVSFIVATGGMSMVKAAYSSNTLAISVGQASARLPLRPHRCRGCRTVDNREQAFRQQGDLWLGTPPSCGHCGMRAIHRGARSCERRHAECGGGRRFHHMRIRPGTWEAAPQAPRPICSEDRRYNGHSSSTDSAWCCPRFEMVPESSSASGSYPAPPHYKSILIRHLHTPRPGECDLGAIT